jgi:hypothetical protein
LWAAVCYNLDVIEDPELDHDLKQRACNALTQTSLAYLKVIEAHEIEQDVRALEALPSSNGHAA